MKKLRFIERKAHGIVDYLMGVLLLVSPWLFGFHEGGPETWSIMIPGGIIILYSLITNFELGVVHILPMGVNLLLDLLIAIELIFAPGLIGFADTVQSPHILFGFIMLFMSLFSKGRSQETSKQSDLPKSVQ